MDVGVSEARASEVPQAFDPAIASTPTTLQSGIPGLTTAGPADSSKIDTLISRYAEIYKIPLRLARRIILRESKFNPLARNGPYFGLMQIRPDTARGVGYRGPAAGLLDAETNLAFGMAYLANAFIVASGDEQRAEQLYRSGFYYEAKRKRMLSRLIRGENRDVLVALRSPLGGAPPADPQAAEDAKAISEISVASAVPMLLPRPRPILEPSATTVAAAPVRALGIVQPPRLTSSSQTEPGLEAQALLPVSPSSSARSAALAAIQSEATLCCDVILKPTLIAPPPKLLPITQTMGSEKPPLPRRRPHIVPAGFEIGTSRR